MTMVLDESDIRRHGCRLCVTDARVCLIEHMDIGVADLSPGACVRKCTVMLKDINSGVVSFSF